jgi:hypothetical protein
MSRPQLIDDVILNDLDSFAFVSDRYGVYPCKSDFYGVEICVLDVDTMTRTVVRIALVFFTGANMSGLTNMGPTIRSMSTKILLHCFTMV